MPLQVACLLLAALGHPATCAASFGGSMAAAACRGAAAVTAAAAGVLLPSALLRHIEQRSRATFLSQLQAAAE